MRALHRLRRDERGLAIASVALLTGVLVLVSALVVIRSMRNTSSVQNDRTFDHAFQLAEAGAEYGSHEVAEDESWFTTSDVPPTFATTADERAWVIAQASALATTSTSNGEYAIVKPEGEMVLYSVAWSPSRDAERVSVRVLKTVLEQDYALIEGWFPPKALIIDGDIKIRGSVNVGGGLGDVHGNNVVTIGGGGLRVEGCVTSSGVIIGDWGSVNGPECPNPPHGQEEVPLPPVDPTLYRAHAQFELCPNGNIRVGQQHPQVLDSTYPSPEEPCTGQVLRPIGSGAPADMGWQFTGLSPSAGGQWTYGTNDPYDGVFYVHEGSITVTKAVRTWNATLIASARVEDECKRIGGDVRVTSHPDITAAPGAASPIAIVAGRDLDWKGNGSVTGYILVEEQVDIGGNPAMTGSAIVNDSCHTPTSPVTASDIGGNPSIFYDEDLFPTNPILFFDPDGLRPVERNEVNVSDRGEL